MGLRLIVQLEAAHQLLAGSPLGGLEAARPEVRVHPASSQASCLMLLTPSSQCTTLHNSVLLADACQCCCQIRCAAAFCSCSHSQDARALPVCRVELSDPHKVTHSRATGTRTPVSPELQALEATVAGSRHSSTDRRGLGSVPGRQTASAGQARFTRASPAAQPQDMDCSPPMGQGKRLRS